MEKASIKKSIEFSGYWWVSLRSVGQFALGYNPFCQNGLSKSGPTSLIWCDTCTVTTTEAQKRKRKKKQREKRIVGRKVSDKGDEMGTNKKKKKRNFELRGMLKLYRGERKQDFSVKCENERQCDTFTPPPQVTVKCFCVLTFNPFMYKPGQCMFLLHWSTVCCLESIRAE